MMSRGAAFIAQASDRQFISIPVLRPKLRRLELWNEAKLDGAVHSHPGLPMESRPVRFRAIALRGQMRGG